MAGHMGDVKVTAQNLEVVATDPEEGFIMVKGAVPGSKGGYVMISDAVKKKAMPDLPFPAAVLGKGDPQEAPVEEAAADDATADNSEAKE